MKVRMGSKKALVFVLAFAVILGLMLGLVLINKQKALADKHYIDSQTLLLGIENKVNSETAENADVSNENDNKVEAEGLTIVPTMKDRIVGNSAYCSTFQIVWNELSDMYLDGKPVEFLNGTLEIADNLNKREFEKEDLDDEYYYVKVGKQLVSTKTEIEHAIKEKFDETSDVLDLVEWTEDSKVDVNKFSAYVFYTMLKRNFEFEIPFEILTEVGAFKNYMNVKYFGVKESSSLDMKKQVDVLYYDDASSFGIKLKTKNGDDVLLMKNLSGTYKTFEEAYQDLNKKEKEFNGSTSLESKDTVSVPNIDFKTLKEYNEFVGKTFLSSKDEEIEITKAVQTIDFSLDNKGGKLKSEAMITTKTNSILIDEEIRNFSFDQDFYIFLKEDDKNKPYFALKVTDISDFQEGVSQMRFYNGVDTEKNN